MGIGKFSDSEHCKTSFESRKSLQNVTLSNVDSSVRISFFAQEEKTLCLFCSGIDILLLILISSADLLEATFTG